MKDQKPPALKMSFSLKANPPRPAQPPAPDARLSAALQLAAQGQWPQAEAAVRALLAAEPQHAGGWKTLAAVLLAQGKDALDAAQKAVARQPQDAQAVCNLGRAFHDRRQWTEAITAYRYALGLRPGLPQALLSLGQALRETGDLAGSDSCLREATRLQPPWAEAFNDLGVTQTAAGQLDAAYQSLRQALALEPGHVTAMTNLGRALCLGQRHDLAASVFDRAIALDARSVPAHLGRADALRELGLLEEAESSYRQALALRPGLAQAHTGLGICLVQQGRAQNALAEYEAAQAAARDDLAVLPCMMFARQYLPDPEPLAWLAEARAFGQAARAHARPFQTWKVSADPGRKLRVGLVSGDLREHPVAHFLDAVLRELVAGHGDRIEWVAYHNHPDEDAMSERLRSRCAAWHRVSRWSDAQLAQQIHADGVDLLVDLAGHTEHNRVTVFAWRAAPVQLNWLGYFATTGIAEMDHLLADSHTVPPGNETHFTENIWRLPATRLCFTPPAEEVPVSALPALANGHITFGCFNHLGKLNARVIEVWSRILQRVPHSRLLLKAKQLTGTATRERLLQAFAAHGIGADRLLLEAGSPRQAYLETYHRVDIGLDPFPYTGGTTTVESLWMGVPVLTLAGATLIGRQGLGLLHNAGLPDWVAHSNDDYVERAVALAARPDTLAALRAQLRAQVLASPLFDAPAFAGHFEQALRGMWTRWCEQQNPSL